MAQVSSDVNMMCTLCHVLFFGVGVILRIVGFFIALLLTGLIKVGLFLS